MKRSLLALSVCLAAALGIATLPAAAQMQQTIKVTLPYAATVGTVTLPAGEFTIGVESSDGNASILTIRAASGATVEAMAMRILPPGIKQTEETKVVLRHVGNKYEIEKIWLADQAYGYQLMSASGRE